jgi:hypothetical protein
MEIGDVVRHKNSGKFGVYIGWRSKYSKPTIRWVRDHHDDESDHHCFAPYPNMNSLLGSWERV